VATRTVEDYLLMVYMLADEGQTVIGARLAEALHVSRPTVTATLKRMVRDGLIRLDKRKTVHLTAKGQEIAAATMRRHRLVERWLTDVLGMGWAQSDIEAHRIEHSLSPEVERLLNKHLGYPVTCPHGNPIPGNPAAPDVGSRSLQDMAVGERVVVQRVAEPVEHTTEVLTYVEQRGLIPGATVVVVDRAPLDGPLTLRVGERLVSISPEVAAFIWAKPA